MIGSFNKQLSAAELKEYRVVCQCERDAEGKGGSETAPATGSTRKAKAKREKPATDQPKKMSALDAAAKVLGESTEPMATKEMAKGYWTSPGGQTPMSLARKEPCSRQSGVNRGWLVISTNGNVLRHARFSRQYLWASYYVCRL